MSLPSASNERLIDNKHRSLSDCEFALIEQGKLALRSIQFQEQAARYHAEAASLQAALLTAEQGDSDSLRTWLAEKNRRLDEVKRVSWSNESFVRVDRPTSPATPISIDEKATAQLSTITDSVADSVPSLVADSTDTFWKSMEANASRRIHSRRHSSADPIEHLLEHASERIKSEASEITETTQLTEPSNVAESNETNGSTEITEASELTEIRPLLIHWNIDTSQSGLEERKSFFAIVRSAPFWVSFLVHVVAVIVLGVVVIQAAKKVEKLAIVSSPIEADNVLTETPMELNAASLEMEKLQTLSPESQLSPSEMISDMVPSMSVDVGTIPSESSTTSDSIAGSLAASLQSVSASKLKAGAEFFGVKATGNVFVYVVDNSPSMRRDGAFDAAKKEIVRSLSSMKPQQRFYISFFGKELEPMSFDPRTSEKFPIPAQPENIKKALNWLNRVTIQDDGWPPKDALKEAIAMQPDGIFLLFDGDTKANVADFLRDVNRTDDILSEPGPKVPIHVIHFFNDEFQKTMKQVAAENGGTYRFVPRPERAKGSKK